MQEQRILVVEDNAVFQRLLCRGLASSGFEVEAAFTATEALEIVTSRGAEISAVITPASTQAVRLTGSGGADRNAFPQILRLGPSALAWRDSSRWAPASAPGA